MKIEYNINNLDDKSSTIVECKLCHDLTLFQCNTVHPEASPYLNGYDDQMELFAVNTTDCDFKIKANTC